MTLANKDGKRSYASAVRRQQAEQTRMMVVRAASQCFAERGFGGTTMKDIAAVAGVSVETVYGHGGKASLLLDAVDQVRTGDVDSDRVADRANMRAVLGAADPWQVLAQLSRLITASLPAALPFLSAFRRAADASPEIATAYQDYERVRWADLRPIATALAPGLRPGIDVDQAADVIWSLLDPTAAEGLVSGRGWTLERWATWVTDALERILLRPHD